MHVHWEVFWCSCRISFVRPTALGLHCPLVAVKDALYLVMGLGTSLLLLRSHSREISFPGGICDGSETPVEAALRETQEELGIELAQLDVWGQMPAVPNKTSNSTRQRLVFAGLYTVFSFVFAREHVCLPRHSRVDPASSFGSRHIVRGRRRGCRGVHCSHRVPGGRQVLQVHTVQGQDRTWVHFAHV